MSELHVDQQNVHKEAARATKTLEAAEVVVDDAAKALTPRLSNSAPSVVTLSGHSGPVNAVVVLLGEIGRADDLVVSCSDDTTIKFWNPWTHTCEQTVDSHTAAVTCLAFGQRDNEYFVVSGSKDKKLIIWGKDSHRWTKYETLRGDGMNSGISSVAVLKDEQGNDMVVSGHDDGIVAFWRFSENSEDYRRSGEVKSEIDPATPIRYVLPLQMSESLIAGTATFATGPLGAPNNLVELWQLSKPPEQNTPGAMDSLSVCPHSIHDYSTGFLESTSILTRFGRQICGPLCRR
jgi:WD40 repeat protein